MWHNNAPQGVVGVVPIDQGLIVTVCAKDKFLRHRFKGNTVSFMQFWNLAQFRQIFGLFHYLRLQHYAR